MHIISSAKSTVLSGFPDFDKKFVYQHVENETNDFQFFALKKLFLEVNKKSGLEFLRIKNVGEDMEICRVKKMRVDNLYCVACPKQEHENIALGLSTGQIKFLNYKTSEYTTKFSAESTRNSVIFLDFNASDEYLSSVYENGIINLYGLKTKTKMETLKFDNNCTLARFHPTKRFHLSVATYKGAVYVYDIQSKRRIFQSADSHAAPCRDICMSPIMPDIMLSVGYDCVINIFDTRKKRQPQQIKHCHPLSTVAISDCGNFCCVGNLKGELLAYDLRNTKNCLNSKKVHDSGVIRVAFVPEENEDNLGNSQIINERRTTIDTGNLIAKTPQIQTNRQTTGTRDSFYDILDFHSFKDKEKSFNKFSTRKDSFDWDAIERRTNDFSGDFRTSFAAGGRLSSNRSSLDSRPRNHNLVLDSTDSSYSSKEMVATPKFKSTSNENLTAATSHKSPMNRSQSVGDLIDKKSKMKFISNITERQKYSNNRHEDLKEIKEEKTVDEDNIDENSTKGIETSKRDVQNMLGFNGNNKEIDYFFKIPDDNKSTPNNNCKRSSGDQFKSQLQSTPLKSNDMQIILNELHKMQTNVDSNFNNFRLETNAKLDGVRTEIESKLNSMESEIKFNNEFQKWNICKNNANYWDQQRALTEDIREAVGYLLQTDPFVNKYLELQKENEMLKQQVLELKERKKY